MILLLFLLIGLVLRLIFLNSHTMFIGDSAWFFISARDALFTGHLPLVGITSSITWLHQGAVWTYLLIPMLAIGNFDPRLVSGITSVFSLANPLFAYGIFRYLHRPKAGILAAGIFCLSGFSVLHSRFAYHTSPVPLFTLVVFYLLFTRRLFLAGVYLAFLYQLHLLTFIFWPIILLLTFRRRLIRLLFGFGIGLLPFLLSGPIQTIGIFLWLFKNALSGFPGVGSSSEAYKVVLFTPLILTVSYLVSRFPRRLYLIFSLVILLFVSRTQPLIMGNLYTPCPVQVTTSLFATDTLPYDYLAWWRTSGARINHAYCDSPDSQRSASPR